MVMPDELPALLTVLERTGLPYALTGSLASTAWGKPRATYDVDVVLDFKAADLDRLAEAFPEPDWYLDRSMMLEAIRTHGEFSAIHGATGTKVDFWVKSNRPADESRFLRRRREVVAGVETWVLSPEDTILAKLEWIKAAPSERQESDVVGIIAVQGQNLDMAYLRDWAGRLDVGDFLEQALSHP